MPNALPNWCGSTTKVIIVCVLVPKMLSPKTKTWHTAKNHSLLKGTPMPTNEAAARMPPRNIEPFNPADLWSGEYKTKFTTRPTTPRHESKRLQNRVAGSGSPPKNSSCANKIPRVSRAVKPTPLRKKAPPIVYAAQGNLVELRAGSPSAGCVEEHPSPVVLPLLARQALDSGKRKITHNRFTAQIPAAVKQANGKPPTDVM
mmetsp:Transcript_103540/g.202996  ORF Transcript_103540/g.202996 Transcript_103540/m.202996 type:complete len:202 (+) Transcript_103540:303-908(+)